MIGHNRKGWTAVMIGHITFCLSQWCFNTIAARVSRLPTQASKKAAADPRGANFRSTVDSRRIPLDLQRDASPARLAGIYASVSMRSSWTYFLRFRVSNHPAGGDLHRPAPRALSQITWRSFTPDYFRPQSS